MKRNSIIHLITNPFFIASFLLLLFFATAINPYKAYDEGLWTYIGWLFNNQGVPPYIGSVENKTPAIFLLFTLADNFGSNNILFVRGLGILVTIATSVLMFIIGKMVSNKLTGVIAMWFFGLVVCWKSLDGFAFAQTETFMVFFTALAFYFMLQFNYRSRNLKWLLFAGLCVGMAINFKQIALTSACAFCLMLLFIDEDNLNRVKYFFVFLFGAILSLFLVYLVLFFNGVSFSDYIEGAWLILLNSGSRITGLEMQFTNFFRTFIGSRMVLILPVFALFIYYRKVIPKVIYAMLGLWFVFDFLGANASGYYYGHQLKQLLPPLSLITAIVLPRLISKDQRFNNVVMAIAVFVFLMLFPLKQLIANFESWNTTDKRYVAVQEAAAYIKKDATSSDFIYVFGADLEMVLVLAEAKLKSSSKYFHSIFITGVEEQEQVFDDLNKNPPKFIVKHKELNNIDSVYGKNTMLFFEKNYKFVQAYDAIELYMKL